VRNSGSATYRASAVPWYASSPAMSHIRRPVVTPPASSAISSGIAATAVC
jgi:hypothetical protein